MKKLMKPKIILGIPLAALSFEIYLGVVLGYFGSKFFVEKLVKTKIIANRRFDISGILPAISSNMVDLLQ